MIIRAKVVVTMDGPPIENGAIAVFKDRIVDVGKFSEVGKDHAAEEVVDLGEQALLPGLINAHCHLDYTCLCGKIAAQKSFTDWIRAINAEKAKLTAEDYVASINDGFIETRRTGITTIANLTAFPELVSQIKAPIRTWWFAEMIDVRNPHRATEIVNRAVENLKRQAHWGLAPHAPFTASADLYRRSEEIAHRENVLLTTHLAESSEEMSMFRDANGKLYDFLKEIGRDMSDSGEKTSVARFSEIFKDSSSSLGKTKRWLLVHMNELSDDDSELLSRMSTGSSIVHCPRSHAYFDHARFEFHKLRELGFNICLGTDSLATNDDFSLFAEMRTFQKEFPDVRPEEILKMVTVNAADALRQGDALGKIAVGLLADLIAVPVKRSTPVFETILEFDQSVTWSMTAGGVGEAG
jgi:cytosine/adenosine deaminase-related metal-dependent hydrolase